MARRKKVYEGKAKVLYEGPEPGTLVQYFKGVLFESRTFADFTFQIKVGQKLHFNFYEAFATALLASTARDIE